MKTVNIKKKLTGLLVLAILFGSCKKTLFPSDINTDPNQSSKDNIIPQVLLPGAEYSIAYTAGGDVSRFSGVLIQTLRGISRQFKAYDQYVFTAQDFDNCWSNFYTQGLNSTFTLKQVATKKGYNFYEGIANVLLAYNFGLATDTWGDVPFSQALQGDVNILQPKYDKQQDIYPALQSLLDSAIILFNGSAGAVKPGKDDFIYGGAISSWIKLAYSLKARLTLHLSKVDNTYADKIIALLPNVLGSNADNASIPFFNTSSQANPWYQYVTQRGDIGYTEGYLYQVMNAQSDPRLNLFIDVANDNIGSAFGSYNSPVPLFTYSEVKFIEAEARSAKGDVAGATLAYNSAITSNMTSFGISAAAAQTYLTAHPLTGADHATRLQGIISQKYLALFTQPESFTDWRRTNIPALTPVSGSNIPRRFLYVQAERDRNSSNVPTGTTLFTKVWWDQ